MMTRPSLGSHLESDKSSQTCRPIASSDRARRKPGRSPSTGDRLSSHIKKDPIYLRGYPQQLAFTRFWTRIYHAITEGYPASQAPVVKTKRCRWVFNHWLPSNRASQSVCGYRYGNTNLCIFLNALMYDPCGHENISTNLYNGDPERNHYARPTS